MHHTANVVPLRQRAAAIAVAARPQILTEDLVKRLSIVNHQVRWLRANNHSTLAIKLRGHRPTLVVSATAAPLLVAVGHGKTTFRLPGRDPVHSVVIAGCRFEWRGAAALATTN